MKKLFPIFLSLLALAACTSEYDKMLNETSRVGKPGEGSTFYATIEGTGAADPQTKVFADEHMRVLWNQGDLITVFDKITYNRAFRFSGNDGDNAGGFNRLPFDDEFATGNDLDHTYAIYPYDSGTKISNDGIISFSLPSVQHYKENSFGIGANTMLSVTDDNLLRFKNAGSYLALKFYGDGISLKSMTLRGNNGEKLAGSSFITMAVGGTPTVVMQDDANDEITLVCDEPVALGADANHCVVFWIVVPPTSSVLE